MPGDLHPKFVPHSPEAEEALIGAILINPDAYDEVDQVLKGEDFYIHRHRFIWEAITRLRERHTPVDFLTLNEELDMAGKLDEIGGPTYLTQLINQVPTSLHAEAYARIIRQAAVRRRILEIASQMAKLAAREDTSLEKVIQESEKALSSITDQLTSPGIQSFPRFSDLLQGRQPSDLVIVAGRPGMGKTSLLLSIVMHAVRVQKKHILVYSLETSIEQLTQRLVAQEAGIETQRIRTGKLEAGEWQLLAGAIEKLKDVQLFLSDTPAINLHQIISTCRRLHSENKLDLVVIDYLQLIGSGEHFENRVQEVSFITRQLKAMARDLDIPVLAAAQLSRAVEQRVDKRPLLSDLRESGSIEMDADIVLLLYSPDDSGSSNLVEIMVAKHRNGPTGTIRLVFQKSLAMFENTPNK
jgi:replicative DNA helicase